MLFDMSWNDFIYTHDGRFVNIHFLTYNRYGIPCYSSQFRRITILKHSTTNPACLNERLFLILSASISVRNVKNIPKVPLTVKPDPSDYRLNPQFQGFYEPPQAEYYYQEHQDSYIRPDISFESTHDLYTQAQLQRAQEINLQQHYQLQDIDRSLAALSNQESPEEKWPSAASKQMFSSREQLTPSHDKSELRVSYLDAGLPYPSPLYTNHNTNPTSTLWSSPTLNDPLFFADLGNVGRGLTEPHSRRTSLAVDTIATSKQQYGTLDRAVLHKHSRHSGYRELSDLFFSLLLCKGLHLVLGRDSNLVAGNVLPGLVKILLTAVREASIKALGLYKSKFWLKV